MYNERKMKAILENTAGFIIFSCGFWVIFIFSICLYTFVFCNAFASYVKSVRLQEFSLSLFADSEYAH